MATISQVVILDDVFDAHKSLFARPDLLDKLAEITVGLTSASLNLVDIVHVPGYQVNDNLIGDEIFPICTGCRRPVGEHGLCVIEAGFALFEDVLDLVAVSRCRM